MSDGRQLQPDRRTLDLTKDTFGGRIYGARIEVWPYSSLKNETVYTRNLMLRLNADDIRKAHGIVQSVSAAVSLAHDVWQTNVRGVWEEPVIATLQNLIAEIPEEVAG